MHRKWIATAFFILLWFDVVAEPSRAVGPSSQNTTTSASADEPCQSKPPTAATPFDTCRYLTLGPGIKPPRATSAPNPEYPEAARQAKLSGTVIVALAVNENGRVDDVRVVRSSNNEFDRNAMDAGRKWQFVPATKDGKPVAVQLDTEMRFSLY
jgi:protein TonB